MALARRLKRGMAGAGAGKGKVPGAYLAADNLASVVVVVVLGGISLLVDSSFFFFGCDLHVAAVQA